MTEADERAMIVAEARAWLGTPYHHHACLKGIGVDCAMLPIGIWSSAGLLQKFDPGPYPADWHQHRDEERYASIVLTLADEIAEEVLQPGDLILFKFGRAFSHGAILVAPGIVAHASLRDGAVILGDLHRDGDMIGRPRRFFSYWAREARLGR
jgi:NlpC/P60 family putative phage cell wall peptidase